MGSLARRVLVSSDAERKRLERALHDGPQQRLVAATTTLGLAQRRLDAGEDGAAELLEQATEEARLCLEELRDLARDIYPTVLAERGLPSALNDLARRAPGVVDVEAAPEERLPEAVELTAYLLVSEALAGLADGAEAVVSARMEDSTLVVEVRGASAGEDQLPGLANRVAGLDGRLEGGSGGGAGVVRASIPVP
jgi:signal transduction histidine kinase